MKLLLVIAAIYAVNAEWNALMENKDLWQGDIVLDPDEKEADMKTVRKGYASIKGGRWPMPIKYKIEHGITHYGVKAIKAAIADYEMYTCLRFVEDNYARGAHISFFKGAGCSSPVGYRLGRTNTISLATGCWRKGTVLHEIGHSIGLYHEQSRPDRDSYVKIIWDNIQGGMGYNFNKQRASNIDSLGTGYDYKSMMHYWGTAFGGGRTTIQTIDPKMQSVIGQRQGFSEIDKKQINLMYCNGSGGGATNPPIVTNAPPGDCKDTDTRCPKWLRWCGRHSYVDKHCHKTCMVC